MNDQRSTTIRGEQPVTTTAQETLPPQNSSANLPSVTQDRLVKASPSPISSYSFELHIEELLLHGFAAADRQGIGESFETELNRLFTDHDAPQSLIRGGEIALSNDLELNLAFDARPEAIGSQIARRIFRSFNQ